jgi:hypothetical protein
MRHLIQGSEDAAPAGPITNAGSICRNRAFADSPSTDSGDGHSGGWGSRSKDTTVRKTGKQDFGGPTPCLDRNKKGRPDGQPFHCRAVVRLNRCDNAAD